jgi:hypothetical protein
MGLGRMLIFAGLALLIAGVLVSVAGRYTSLGRLPGDVIYRRGTFTFYFPIVTSILLSILLTAVMWLMSRR